MADADTILCPQCHAAVTRRVAGSRYAVCPACSSWLELKGTVVSVGHATGRNDAMTLKPGMSCRFDGCEWVVTGCAQQSNDDRQTEQWMEYKLYCAEKSWYRSLVEYRGHWLWTGPTDGSRFMTTTMKVKGIKRVRDREENVIMTQYTRYNQRTLPIAGEFATDVLRDNGGKMIVEEYQAAPLLAVKEIRPGKKHTWYAGTYLKPRQVARLFGISIWKLPLRRERISAEPRLLQRFSSVWLFFIVSLAMVFMARGVVGWWKPEKIVLSASYEIEPDTSGWSITTYKPIANKRFDVTRSGALEIAMKAGVNNEWLELQTSITNEEAGTEYEAVKTAEHWEGNSSDGHWVEDNSVVKAVFSEVPPGHYVLNIYPSAEVKRMLPVTVEIKECAVLNRNTRWFAGVLCCLAGGFFLYKNRDNLKES